MTGSAVEIEAEGIAARLDLTFGMIEELQIERDGRVVSMLHKAPWLGTTVAMPSEAAPHLAGLAGDFFCAPFGNASADSAPGHGWPANSSWSHVETRREGAQTIARFQLDRKALGATLVKELRLVDGHPFLYQRHIFIGGQATGAAVANHAMLHLPNGGTLSFSPKRWWETPSNPLESDPARGRSLLAYPAKAASPRDFPRSDGGIADLTHYPFGTRHEDFAVGIEAEGRSFGWTSVARSIERDLFISLRNAALLPMTMLWFSNGGRDYAPWNGRHRDVLGVEEGIVGSLLGASANESPNPLNAAGVPTGVKLSPDATLEVRHVTGSVPWSGDGAIDAIEPVSGGLQIRTRSGEQITLPCDTEFLHV